MVNVKMANKNYIGHEYFCSVCKSFFIATDELISEVELVHENGEQLSVITIECFSCRSMSIPEGMNQITWLKEGMGLEKN